MSPGKRSRPLSTGLDGDRVRSFLITAWQSLHGHRTGAARGSGPHPGPCVVSCHKLILDALLLKEQWKLVLRGEWEG